MYENPYEDSLEPRLLSATPLETVVMLYDGAIAAVEDARRCLQEGRIPDRSRAVTKAVGILGELAYALDHNAGGEFSARLAALYDYMQRRLLDANSSQTDDGLAETLRLLNTVREAWATAARADAPAATPAPITAPSSGGTISSEISWACAPAEHGSSQGWSA